MMSAKIRFREARHLKTGEPIIELWKGNILVGCIYFHENYISVLSKYFESSKVSRFPVPHDSAKVGTELRVFFRVK
mgnify:CR=1 FL=1